MLCAECCEEIVSAIGLAGLGVVLGLFGIAIALLVTAKRRGNDGE